MLRTVATPALLHPISVHLHLETWLPEATRDRARAKVTFSRFLRVIHPPPPKKKNPLFPFSFGGLSDMIVVWTRLKPIRWFFFERNPVQTPLVISTQVEENGPR